MDKYDVFISCKSEDYSLAEEVYNYLHDNYVNAFLAPKELRKLGTSEYREAIESALESAKHLIIVASDASFITSTWVKYEWDLFIDAKTRGEKKGGNILTILQNVKLNEIPFSLRRYESFSLESFKDNIINYVDTEDSRKRRQVHIDKFPHDNYSKNTIEEDQYGQLSPKIKNLIKSAERGNIRSQIELAQRLLDGVEIQQNETLASFWYRKAAEKGSPSAQYNLATILVDGENSERDIRQALFWYIKAAEQGHIKAQFNLGRIYEEGKEIGRNGEEAVKWYTKAALQDDYRAQTNLGIMYQFGYGIEPNPQKAVEWYKKAASRGSDIAKYNLGRMYLTGDGVEQNVEEALKWIKNAACQGYRKAVEYLKSIK